MKKLLFSLFTIALAWSAYPQGAPQAINYQAVARDLTGEPVANRPIAVQFSIRTGNANGTVVYREEHFTTTNLLGLFHAQIGRGIVVSGDFSIINWGATPHFISIEVDYTGGGAYQLLGAYELISVPYALYAETAGNAGTDLDEQQLSYANDTIYLTNGGWVYLPSGTDDQSLILSNDTLYISNGGGFVYLGDYVDDADSDPTNEIQDLSLTGNILIITNNTAATQIDLAPYLDNTDAQQLSLSNDTLYLTNGGSVYLPPATASNAQDLALSNDTLTITNNTTATPIYLGSYLDNTDNQTLSYDPATGILSISGPAASTVTITLPSGGDDWGTQTATTTGAISGDGTTANPIALAQQGATTGQVLVWNGTAWAPANDAVNDNDSDPANEIQDLSYNPLTQILTITNNAGATAIDLSALLDNTDSQNLSFDPATGDLTISGGTGVTLPISSGGDNWGTQTAATNATLTGNGASSNPLGLAQQGATTGQVLVWNGTAWAPANDAVNDADSDPANEIQDLNLTGNILTITNNGTATQIDLAPYLDNTDDQTLSYDPLTGALTISGASGSSVTLPIPTGDDWGTQTAATTGAISGDGTTANPIALAQQGATTGQVLVWNGTTWAPANDAVNDADSDPANEIQDLNLTGNILTITNNGTATQIDLAPYLDNTDDQTLSYDPLTGALTISGASGSSVTLPIPIGDDWGTQTAATTGAISGDGTTANPIALAQQGATTGQVLVWNGTTWAPANDAVNDADFDPTNEIQDLSYDALTQNLTITNNAGATVVNLSALLDNTDSQTLSFDPLLNELSITNGNSIPLPAPAGDNWGTQSATTTGAITGDGTAGSPIALAQQGATAGQVLVWNGTTWAPAADQVDDADSDPTNEIQTLSYDPLTGLLTISGTGGNSVTLPIPTGDNWGTQSAATNATLSGNGTGFSPLGLAQQSATPGQVLEWNGSAWVPAADNDNQSLSYDPLTYLLSISGALGSVNLSGLMDDWGAQTAATSGLITGNGVAPDAIRLADGTVPNQVMKWNGTTWAPAADQVDDADSDPTNEIQTLSYDPLTGILTISELGGNSVTLPIPTGDDWGTQSAVVNGPLQGTGITGDALRIADGTAAGDILEWNGTAWVVVPNPGGGGTLDDAYDFGGAGAGRQILTTNGSVLLGGNDGLIVTDNTSTSNSFVNLAQGHLMYFNPANGVFRAGRMFTAGLWNTTNVGSYSFAVNHNTDAGGTNSFASGLETEASGNNSFAAGSQTEASGAQSVTFGSSTHASGANSFSIGESTEASATNSFAAGLSTTSSGQQSVAFGQITTASANQAAAFGAGTTASAVNSTAFGFGTFATAVNAFAVGNGTTASGAASAVFGNTNTAVGTNSFSAGSTNRSRVINSITLGEGLVVTGRAGIALGHFNDTSSFQSDQINFSSLSWPVLMVGNGTANGARNNAMVVLRNGNVGIDTDQPAEKLEVNGNIRMPFTSGTATGTLYLDIEPFLHTSGGVLNTSLGVDAGNHSLVSGTGNTAIGNSALGNIIGGTGNTALGRNALSSITGGNNNVAVGLSAAENKTSSGYLVAVGDYALANGSVSSEGSVAVGTSALQFAQGNYNTAVGYTAGVDDIFSPTTLLQGGNTFIGAEASYSNNNITNAGAFGFGAVVNASNQIIIGNASVSQVGSTTGWFTTSDKRFKTNIQNSELGLDFVMRLRPVTYNMVEGHEGILYTGLVAQEVEEILNEMGVEFSGLKKPMGETDHYGIRYGNFTVPLIKAVQEQQAEIDALRAENEALRRQVEYIMSIVEGKD